MIEVLEHGNTCRGKCCDACGCVFTYTKADTIKHFEAEGPVRKINCPECGKTLTVNDSKREVDENS